MLALTGLVTKVSARGRAAGTAPRQQPAAPAITLQPEPRAVARQDLSL